MNEEGSILLIQVGNHWIFGTLNFETKPYCTCLYGITVCVYVQYVRMHECHVMYWYVQYACTVYSMGAYVVYVQYVCAASK